MGPRDAPSRRLRILVGSPASFKGRLRLTFPPRARLFSSMLFPVGDDMDWRRQTQRCWLALLVALVLLTGAVAPGSPPSAEPAPYPLLSSEGEPLRAAFNHDAGSVRLLLILDPT